LSTRPDELKTWLVEEAGIRDFRIEPASADASFRHYFRVFTGDKTFIVMDAPPGKESCADFIDITERLLAAGINAPEIYKQDQQQGFVLLSDLGNQQYLQQVNNDNVDDFYRDAIGALHVMQAHCETEGLPLYDEALLRTELMLFNDWLVNKHIGHDFSMQENCYFQDLHDQLVVSALEQPQVFVHRDYHSRNLMVTPGNNPGVLDYQDAVLGPVTYDIVSLLKDCYVKWPEKHIHGWLGLFREGADLMLGPVDAGKIQRWFDLMGVQRHLKASGIFCRLYHRDGKEGYLNDIPRTLSYIVDLRPDYPELQPLCDFIESIVLPEFKQVNV